MNYQPPPFKAENSITASHSSVSPNVDMDDSTGAASVSLAFPQGKKKPGPKRDSKPAPSERLERNRQAQRTHRERKEQYTKELEVEVLRLRELYVAAVRERDAATHARDEALQTNRLLHDENLRMREVVQTSSSSSVTDSGYDGATVCSAETTPQSSSSYPIDGCPGMLALAPTTEASLSTGAGEVFRGGRVGDVCEWRGCAPDKRYQHATADSAPSQIEHSRNGEEMALTSTTTKTQATTPLPLGGVAIDYDDLALDFVLTLERPCMTHIQYLHVRAHNQDTPADSVLGGQPEEVPNDDENRQISGHALMHTAPPYSHIMERPGTQYPTRYPAELRREDLLRLLDLSSQLQITAPELPPVRAWNKIMHDGRLALLSIDDFNVLKQVLVTKVHCYRFGAVLDEADVDEALHYVMEAKTSRHPVPSLFPSANVLVQP